MIWHEDNILWYIQGGSFSCLLWTFSLKKPNNTIACITVLFIPVACHNTYEALFSLVL